MTDVPTLRPEHLRHWLESRPPSETAGIAGSMTRCPLANYLHDLTGLGCLVGRDYYCCHGPDDSHASAELPAWALLFAAKVDRVPFLSRLDKAHALRLLDAALAETTPDE